jgi:hypothetical protein
MVQVLGMRNSYVLLDTLRFREVVLRENFAKLPHLVIQGRGQQRNAHKANCFDKLFQFQPQNALTLTAQDVFETF